MNYEVISTVGIIIFAIVVFAGIFVMGFTGRENKKAIKLSK